MRVCSIDIGRKNFAFYIEEFVSKKFASLEDVYTSGRSIDFGVFDLTTSKSNDYTFDVRKNLSVLLNSYYEDFAICDVILIEQQFFNKKSANVDAIKLGESTLFYFISEFYPQKQIIIFPAKYKTQRLGMPFKIEKKGKLVRCNKYDRKKWSVNKAIEILTLRGETDTIKKLNIKKKGGQKLDDVCDCIIQLQAWKGGGASLKPPV